MRAISAMAAAISCALAAPARADVLYLTQDRSLTVETSANAATQTITAPNFGPFVETVTLSTTFPLVGGGTAVNLARAGIDCQLDPTAIAVVGDLTGSGGVGLVGGNPTLQMGEAAARVEATFRIDLATSFLLTATPRPALNTHDRWKVKLENLTNPAVLFFIDETAPPQAVNLGGVLPPGDYAIEFEVELAFDGPETLRNFAMTMAIPAPGSAALLGLAVFAVRRRR